MKYPREIVLLGAGASAKAGVPLARQMTQAILDKKGYDSVFVALHARNNHPAAEFGVFEAVVKFLENTHGGPSIAGVDIERVANTIQALWMKDISVLAPFVEEWRSEVEQIITKLSVYDYPWLVGQICDLTYKDFKPEEVNYLFPLFSYSPKDIQEPPFVIATVNYDNTIEKAAEYKGVSLQTGMNDWSRKRRFPPIEEGTWLLKLHGSASWRRVFIDGGRPLGTGVVEETNSLVFTDAEEGFFQEPEIIFGGENKLTAFGPYLGIFSAFQEALYRSDRLTVIGYSFRDTHINQVIQNWYDSNDSVEVRVIDTSSFTEADQYVGQELLKQDRVEHIAKYAQDGIPMCFQNP